MLTKDIENLLYITTFLRPSVELAIGIGTCPTLAKTIVTLGIHMLSTGNSSQVLFAFMHILAPFQYDGAQSQLNKTEGSKQTTRASSYHNDLGTLGNNWIVCTYKFIVGRLFVHVEPYLQIDKDSALASINGAFQNAHTLQGTERNTFFIGNIPAQMIRIGCHLRQYT